MSAERAAERIFQGVSMRVPSPTTTFRLFNAGVMANIIREETKCDKLAEALEDVESILPAGDDWEADGIRITKEMARKIRAVMAGVRGEG